MGGEREQKHRPAPGKGASAGRTGQAAGKSTRVSPPKGAARGPIMDHDGEILAEAGRATEPGNISLQPSHDKWKPMATAAETVTIVDDAGDAMRLEVMYRLESRPGELGDPNIHVVTERRALLTLGSGEHISVRINGQAIAIIGADDALDPRRAATAPSIGADHTATIYIDATEQYINVFGHNGERVSLVADAADNDLLAYDDPLRMLMALKRTLKQERVAGHGAKVASVHQRIPKLLASVEDVSKGLREHIVAVKQYLDGKPGEVGYAEFVLKDLTDALAELRRQGRGDSDDAKKLAAAHRALLALHAEAKAAKAPEKGFTGHLVDAVTAPVRLVGRTLEGAKELGAMVTDAVVLGVEAAGKATDLWDFDWDPISDYGKWAKDSGGDSLDGLTAIAQGFVDSWSNAIERAGNGDYSGLMDVGLDTALMVDGARATVSGVVAKAPQVIAKAESLLVRARALVKNGRLPAELRDIAAAVADASDAFLAKQRAAGMQMAGGPKVTAGGGPTTASLAEGIDAAKSVYAAKRAEQAKGRALDAIKKRLGKEDAPDAAEWVTRVEAAFAGDSKKAARFFKDIEIRVSDPAPFMREVEAMLGSNRLGADDLAAVLSGALHARHVEPARFLGSVRSLLDRNLSLEARSALVGRAIEGKLDLDWLSRTKLADRDIELMCAEKNTAWWKYEQASDLSSKRTPDSPAPDAGSAIDVNVKLRGIAGESVASDVQLPGGMKIKRRVPAGNAGGRTPDYELIAPDGSIAEMEVKAHRAENWPQMLDEWDNTGTEAQLQRMIEQLDAARSRGHQPYLAITDRTSIRTRRRLLTLLAGRIDEGHLVLLPESEILRVAAELRDKMGIPQPVPPSRGAP